MESTRLWVCFLVALCISPMHAEQYHKVRLGENASVLFHHNLPTEDTAYAYDLFAPEDDCVLCRNQTLDAACLGAGRRGRYFISTSKQGRDVRVAFTIHDVVGSDEGFYVLSWRLESAGGVWRNLLQATYIDAAFPPGRAECRVQASSYSEDWQEVHCSARSGSHGTGNLTCLQLGQECVFLRALSRSDTHISAVFWVSADYPVNCCSFEDHWPGNPRLCSDFKNGPVTIL